MATVGVVAILPILILCLVVTMFVVVFVSRDASKRNMNALLWALVAALAPLFLGLIIYFICRKPLVDLQCPKCGTGISQDDRHCPSCGYAFVTQCPECQFPVQKGWTTCPSCGNVLPKDYGQPVRAYRKDNSMVALIVAVVLVTLTLVGTIFTLFSISRGGTHIEEIVSYGGFSGMYNITSEDMSGNATVADWVKGCKDTKDAHVLLSTTSGTCIVYLPKQDTLLESNLSIAYTDAGDIYLDIYVNVTGYEDKYGYDFFLYEIDGLSEASDITTWVYLNDRECESTLTITNQDISMESWGGQSNE